MPPLVKTIPEILAIAKVSQYLAHRDILEEKGLQRGSLDSMLHIKIFTTRTTLQRIYDLNPNDLNLRKSANYLYMMLGKYAKKAETVLSDTTTVAAPIVTGPAPVIVNDGQNASFTIVVTSTLPTTISWFKNGILVPGQTGLTYSFPALLADNGSHINAVASSPAGSTPSAVALLTVNTQLQGRYYYGDTDYRADLDNGIIANIPWNGNFNVTEGAPLFVEFPLAATPNKFIIVEYPATESIKNNWENTPGNKGDIPDSVFDDIVTIADKRYVPSRVAMSLEAVSPTLTIS